MPPITCMPPIFVGAVRIKLLLPVLKLHRLAFLDYVINKRGKNNVSVPVR
ncbi:hypothetical protein Csa_023513 [Cucumis sativus]|nr:hypothetical protein Csa_023513 [Cucumis sativus]